MKISLKNWSLSFLIIFFSISSVIKTYPVHLSFDSLFPMTWYHKGLESLCFVWHALKHCLDSENDQVILSHDVLLGRLVLVQFCINRMQHEDISVTDLDDEVYFIAILGKIQNLLNNIIVTSGNHDFILCAQDIIQKIEQQFRVSP